MAVLPPEEGHAHASDADRRAVSKEEVDLQESRNGAVRRKNRAGSASV